MTREEVMALLSTAEAIAIGTRSCGGLEAFLDDVIKHNVTAEELKRWVATPPQDRWPGIRLRGDHDAVVELWRLRRLHHHAGR
jgi:hypothetical protein